SSPPSLITTRDGRVADGGKASARRDLAALPVELSLSSSLIILGPTGFSLVPASEVAIAVDSAAEYDGRVRSATLDDCFRKVAALASWPCTSMISRSGLGRRNAE